MTNIVEPFVSVNITNAAQTVGNDPQRVLFVGQQTATNALDGTLVENIQTTADANTLFGEGSMLATMIAAARELNEVVQFDAVVFDDAAGTPAEGSFDISGTGATEDGTLTFSIGSEANNSYTIAVSDGDAATDVATALNTAIGLDDTSLVAAALDTSDVDLTANNSGTIGNYIGLKVSGSVDGIIVTIVAMGVGVTGATDPTLTNWSDVVGDNRYQGVVWPYTTTEANIDELTGFLDPRFNASNAVLDGVGFCSITDSLAEFTDAVTGHGLVQNSQSLVIIGDKAEDLTAQRGPAQLEYPPSKAAMFAAIRALRLTEDASISDFVITANGALDAFGGAALASKPYFNTPFPDLPLITTGLGWTSLEIDQLKAVGITVFGNNQVKNGAISGEIVTTYLTDSAGNPDVTFTFLNYVDTATSTREYFDNNLRSRFAQSRLTEGDVIRGRDMANDLTIAGFLEGLYQDLSGPEFVLVQAGEAAFKFFKDNLVVTLEMSTGSASVQMQVPIVTQLRSITVTQQITFSTGA